MAHVFAEYLRNTVVKGGTPLMLAKHISAFSLPTVGLDTRQRLLQQKILADEDFPESSLSSIFLSFPEYFSTRQRHVFLERVKPSIETNLRKNICIMG
jgi:hypothetical protein